MLLATVLPRKVSCNTNFCIPFHCTHFYEQIVASSGQQSPTKWELATFVSSFKSGVVATGCTWLCTCHMTIIRYHDKHLQTVKLQYNLDITNVQKFIESMWGAWNSMAIKRLHKCLKHGLYFSRLQAWKLLVHTRTRQPACLTWRCWPGQELKWKNGFAWRMVETPPGSRLDSWL